MYLRRVRTIFTLWDFMSERRLHSKAWIVLGLQALYHAAEGMCAIFVAVYLWINSHDFDVVCRHYLALYCVIPFVFILAGWYSQARDRLHVYRFGLLVHAVYYATLLTLRERAPEFAVPLWAPCSAWPGGPFGQERIP